MINFLEGFINEGIFYENETCLIRNNKDNDNDDDDDNIDVDFFEWSDKHSQKYSVSFENRCACYGLEQNLSCAICNTIQNTVHNNIHITIPTTMIINRK